mgnify:FL=1
MASYGEILNANRDPNAETESLIHFILIVLAIFAFFLSIFTFVYNGVRVDGDSMMNTLQDGDYLFMNLIAEPERGDIVVVHTGRKEADYVIKRVIALGGDEIYAEDGVLYRKCAGETEFSVVEENYLPEPWVYVNEDRPNSFGSKAEPLVIGENEIFYMGDNRNVSVDCRAANYGPQPIENVTGVVTEWSLSIKGFLTSFFDLFTAAVPES